MTGEGKVVESLLLHSEYWGGLLQNAGMVLRASKKREAVANIVTRGRRRESFASRPTTSHVASQKSLLFFSKGRDHCTGVAIEGL